MSSIINYRCSNPTCSLEVSLRVNFPVWREDTPNEYMKVPIGTYNEQYVLGYKNQTVCWACHSIVDVLDGSNVCPDCGGRDKILGEGTPCGKCCVGTVEVDEDAPRPIF